MTLLIDSSSLSDSRTAQELLIKRLTTVLLSGLVLLFLGGQCSAAAVIKLTDALVFNQSQTIDSGSSAKGSSAKSAPNDAPDQSNSPATESDSAPGSDTKAAQMGDFAWKPLVKEPRNALRAWESRPYQVAVWICHRGEPELAVVEAQLFADIESTCELLDASSWFVTCGTPPAPTRNAIIHSIDQSVPTGAFETDPLLKHYDKLMIVRLDHDSGTTNVTLREYDLQTGQWGPIVDRTSTNLSFLGDVIGRGIAQAFMPLATIDRVDEEKKVHIIARATKTCVRVEWTNESNPEVVPITSSPVYIRDTDRFLPIIRKTDRSGNLVSLDPIEFTFLTVDSIHDHELIASIHSNHPAPLAQRKRKRSQKLALVIRPVQRPSILHLESSDKKNPKPLEGYEVWARRPGDTKEDKSTFLGKSDWKGDIEIPPSEEGLRLIWIKRGARPLRKLPVIPGFKDRLVSKLPNDDARLFAEGVIRGYGNEIVNLVTQRLLLEKQIDALIKQDDFEKADEILQKYKDLETPTEMKRRMSNEEVRLKSMTKDTRESEYISKQLAVLKDVLSKKVAGSREIELQEKLQNRTLGK